VHEALFWLYLANATLLINHEIDSAYWREWNLFFPAKGEVTPASENRNMAFFLLAHLPLVFLILYGLVGVYNRTNAGLVISLLLAGGGLFAFCAHMFFLRKGHKEFNTPVSLLVLIATLPVSLAQGVCTLVLLFQ
jgi:hypothetical protein